MFPARSRENKAIGLIHQGAVRLGGIVYPPSPLRKLKGLPTAQKSIMLGSVDQNKKPKTIDNHMDPAILCGRQQMRVPQIHAENKAAK